MQSTEYPRMLYAHDQREWVRIANKEIPEYEELLLGLQKESAELFKAIQAGYNQAWSWSLYRQINNDKHNLMHRLIQLHGMRNANA